MSRALITLDEARRHLRIDDFDSSGGPDDPDLTLKVEAASAAVLNYLKSGADVFLDSNGDVPVDSAGEPIVPFEVKAATCLMLGYLFRLRDANDDGAFEMGYLPKPVMALLYPLRDPALS